MDDKKVISDEEIYMQQVDPHNPTHVYVCFTKFTWTLASCQTMEQKVLHSHTGYIFFCENGLIAWSNQGYECKSISTQR